MSFTKYAFSNKVNEWFFKSIKRKLNVAQNKVERNTNDTYIVRNKRLHRTPSLYLQTFSNFRLFAIL